MGIKLCNKPGQYSIKMKTSYTPVEVLFQAASTRWTILGWPFRIRCGPLEIHRPSQSRRRTMMSTSFLTSVSFDSFGTAIRLRT